MKQILLNRKEFNQKFSEIFDCSKLNFSRFSITILNQINRMYDNRTIDIYHIIDEVKWCENLKSDTYTTNPTIFKKHPLKGLRKKHFFDAHFIPANISAYFGMKYGGNKKLNELIQQAFDNNTSGFVDDTFAYHISNGLTVDALKQRFRESKITGEWIVFQKYKEQNYYLTLASHKEDDHEIYKRVLDCYKLDYPFLQEDSI